MRVFVSFNSQDVALARNLETTLLNVGFADVWLGCFDPGSTWPREIEEEASSADAVIVAVSQNGATFTQGVEVGVALANRVPVIPVLLGSATLKKVPHFLRSAQVEKIEEPRSVRNLVRSRVAHALHAVSVPRRARKDMLRIAMYAREARAVKKKPRPQMAFRELRESHAEFNIRRPRPSVGEATKGQQRAALKHLQVHAASERFLNCIRDGMDENYYSQFSKCVDNLREQGVSAQLTLRTFALADHTSVRHWAQSWKLGDSLDHPS